MSVGPDPFLPGMSGPVQREPRAELRTAAAQMHELFVALTGEGFTEPQALAVLGAMLATNKS